MEGKKGTLKPGEHLVGSQGRSNAQFPLTVTHVMGGQDLEVVGRRKNEGN